MSPQSTASLERAALLSELAAELLHHYATGRRLIGVDGADRGLAARFADEFADVLRERGAEAVRASASPVDFDAAAFREEMVIPFRSGERDALLVVDGPLLGTAAADTLAWSVWLDSGVPGLGGPETRTSADAIVDVTDAEHPVRRFSDWCVVPRR